MDFIDDFIQEYKNNPCLWKADSANFRNRSKRQEAYMKLIDVAAKHGEHYNVERTKQKINNLRCAFRHQLKKYLEFKSKPEKDEAYCPKRRYFESLMFLKDEEIPDRKATIREGEDLQHPKSNSIDNGEDTTVRESQPSLSKKVEITNVISLNSAPKIPNRDMEKSIKTSAIMKPTTKSKKYFGFPLNVVECEEEKSENAANDLMESNTSAAYTCLASQVSDLTKESSPREKGRCNNRKRSLSVSSHLSNETEHVSAKNLKVEFTPIDFENIFSLACKSIQTNAEDHFANFGKIIAHKLRTMESTQAIYAERIIADVLFQGQMKLLSTLSVNNAFSLDGPSSYGLNNNK